MIDCFHDCVGVVLALNNMQKYSTCKKTQNAFNRPQSCKQQI